MVLNLSIFGFEIFNFEGSDYSYYKILTTRIEKNQAVCTKISVRVAMANF